MSSSKLPPTNTCMNCGEGFTPSHRTFRGNYCPECAEHWNKHGEHR